MIKILVSLVFILVGSNAHSIEQIHEMAGFWELNTKERGVAEKKTYFIVQQGKDDLYSVTDISAW